jgi:hypothetical protein
MKNAPDMSRPHGVTSPMYPVDNATSSYQTVLPFAA